MRSLPSAGHLVRIESTMSEPHSLQEELCSLVSSSPEILEFLQSGSPNSLWYGDIQDPEQEWMNARFWELLGYDPSQKKHLASEWQDLIHADDLPESLENSHRHGVSASIGISTSRWC